MVKKRRRTTKVIPASLSFDHLIDANSLDEIERIDEIDQDVQQVEVLDEIDHDVQQVEHFDIDDWIADAWEVERLLRIIAKSLPSLNEKMARRVTTHGWMSHA